MSMVDEQGRLFGKVHLFDAIVAVLVLWLIPMGYGAYVLFRTPPPTLTQVEPAVLTYGPNMRIKVRGANFRPYLRVYVGTYQGMTFLFNDSTQAEVNLLDVPPGVYDVVLYDHSQERHRLPKALTIAPSALPEAHLIAVGAFGNLTAQQVPAITPVFTIEGVGRVLRVGRAVPQVARVFVRPGMVDVPVPNAQMVPAELQLACWVRSSQGQPECVGGGASLQPTTLLFLNTSIGTVPFQIDQVRSALPLERVRVRVRFAGPATVLAQRRKGDADLGDVRNELSATGTIEDVGPTAGSGDSAAREALMTLQAQRGSGGWVYATAPLRMGGTFVLRTPVYEVRGTVIALDPLPSASQRPTQ